MNKAIINSPEINLLIFVKIESSEGLFFNLVNKLA
jgi:hypothetical protein